MTQVFNEDVEINDSLEVDGSADETQITVQGHTTQTSPLQSWEDSAGNPLARVTGDGRFQVGDEPGMSTPDALMEIGRDAASTTKPKRGLTVAGTLDDETGDPVDWSVHELTISGDATALAQATALRAAVIADDEADLDNATALQVAVDNQSTGTITEAVGIEVEDINQGTANFAIRTGAGLIHLGDALELDTPSVPATPGAGLARVYPKSDKRLYVKNEDGDEILLSRQVIEDTFANRPASDVVEGDLFIPSDGFSLDRFDGSDWQSYGPLYKLTPPDLTEFAWINQETATGVQQGGSVYLETGFQTGDDFRILKKSAPSTPYTITAMINPLTWHLFNNSFGLIWRNSSSGKFMIFGFLSSSNFVAADRNYRAIFYRFNSPNSFSSAPWSQAIPVAPRWLRLSDDGTNRKIYYSLDGIHWIEMFSESRTNFITPDEVGFALNGQDSGATGEGKAAIHLLSWEEG